MAERTPVPVEQIEPEELADLMEEADLLVRLNRTAP
jgi:hypothetical protein